jgi:hypothetical protein
MNELSEDLKKLTDDAELAFGDLGLRETLQST